MTFPASRNATSSPGSVDGPLQLDLLDGLIPGPSGPDPARVSHSRRRAKEPVPMMQGICGRTYFGSPVPDGPLNSWESRLRDRLATDLASEGYASRTVDIPALAVDAPHQRNRLYWVAVADTDRSGSGSGTGLCQDGSLEHGIEPANGDGIAGVDQVDASRKRRGEGWAEHELRGGRDASPQPDGEGVTQGDAFSARLEGQRGHGDRDGGRPEAGRSVAEADGTGVAQGDTCSTPSRGNAGTVSGTQATGDSERCESWSEPYRLQLADGRNGSWWAGADWILCHDGKARRVADASAPLLVNGFPNRILAWRGLGNAIVPPLAAEVLAALLDVRGHVAVRAA